MKSTAIVVAATLFFMPMQLGAINGDVVTPRPLEVVAADGVLLLSPNSFAYVPPDSGEYFFRALAAAGARLKPVPADAPAKVQFLGIDSLGARRKPVGDGYVIRIQPETAIVHAATAEGHINGLHTLVQLVENAVQDADGNLRLPCGEIFDQPRFAYRGFMLDESRHFTGEVALKRLLDAMARFKLNRLHWHLTDSPAWRLEIEAFPELTRIGSRGAESDVRPDAPARSYTRDQVRRIVAYARERGIVIFPEITMPGHADAAVRSYPEHDGGGFLQPGSTVKWPHFTFNPAKPETLAFLQTVLKEVAELFPDAGMIHIDGSEVDFGWQGWNNLSEVKQLMADEGFSTLVEVESWFLRRMASHVGDLGFRVGVWDDGKEHGLPAESTVRFWWRHDKPEQLRRILDAGHPVVLSPRRPCYFDFVQHDSHQVGRRWQGGINPLADVHAFPAEVPLQPGDEARIEGVQACLWTETAVTQARRDFLTWPRLIAFSEAAWTAAARKDYADFESRLPASLDWLKAAGIGFYDPFTNSPEIGDQGATPEYLDTAP